MRRWIGTAKHIRAMASLLWLFNAPVFGQQELDFASGLTQFRDLRQMLPRYLLQRAERLLEERQRQISKLTTAEAVKQRQEYIRQVMREAVGGFPERTPLNARLVGTIDQASYKIEKIIFESQPGFYVTANLYLPKRGTPPYPAVLYPLGHEPGGKSYEVWQRMLGTLASEGYVALTWDPLGQGERAQLYDADLEQQKLGSSTVEHTMLGISCLLIGDNLARYTIWDGIRALDYLLSRPEVDPERVICTGNSGGGTHTAYLSALDDRIKVAAPSCYLTSWRALLKTIGPQDAEQVLLPWLARGLDHPDFVIAFAPKPYLILSAIRDFFSISGARATYEEARRIYAALGAPEKVSMAEVDAGHGYHLPNRLAAYRWFNRWILHRDPLVAEPAIELLDFDELACTETGQVATSLGGETVFTLNRKRARELNRKLSLPNTRGELAAFQAEVRRRVTQLTGIEHRPAPVRAEPYGVIERDAYRIEKLIYWSEPGILIPALLFVPQPGTVPKAPVLYVDGRGKSTEARLGGDLDWLARQGYPVLVPDLRGWGETRPDAGDKGSVWNQYFGDYDSAMTAFVLGDSLLAMRIRDVLVGLDLLTERFPAERPILIGRGLGSVPALYAATLDDRVSAIALEEMLVSYQAVTEQPVHRRVLENIIPGVLKHFDLPDLVAALAPRPLMLINPVNPLQGRIPPPAAETAYSRAAQTYQLAGVASQFVVARRRQQENAGEVYGSWLEMLAAQR